MSRRILSTIIAVLLLAAIMPAHIAGGAAPRYATPSGYNEHDYQKLVAFLEIADSNGVKNGRKLSDGYSPTNPATWQGTEYSYSVGGYVDYGVFFNDEAEKRVVSIISRPGFSYRFFGDLDVAGCIALEEISCESDLITSADLTGCSALRTVDLTRNELEWVSLDGCAALERFLCTSGNLTSLDLAGCPALEELICDNNSLPTLDVSCCPLLTKLDCNYNDLTAIDLSLNSQLEYLDCSDNDIMWLDLTGCPELQYLNCRRNELGLLYCSYCPALDEIDCHGNDIELLTLEGCTELVTLDCSSNPLVGLDLTSCPNLIDLYCRFNHLSRIDLTGCMDSLAGVLTSEHGGFVGVEAQNGWGSYRAPVSERVYYYGTAFAEPLEGWSFVGWYNGSGALVSTEEMINIGLSSASGLKAVFEREPGFLFGDADGSGTVEAADALLILRSVLGLNTLPDSALARCDVNGDGNIDAGDALLALRLAMGLAAL